MRSLDDTRRCLANAVKNGALLNHYSQGMPSSGRRDEEAKSQLCILHITAWYPTPEAPLETPFVQRHVHALDAHVENHVWHVDVRPGARWSFRRNPKAERGFIVRCATQRWRVIEWVAGMLVLWAWLTRDRRKRIDAINFHLAYPNCAWIRLLRVIMRRPMAITEHFSAYHFKFNGTGSGMRRIKRIFHQGIPVFVVSHALESDIKEFAGPPWPPFRIIDNAVDTSLFKANTAVSRSEGRFFALAQWRYPKRPEILIDAIAALRKRGYAATLRVGGTGPMSAGLADQVRALGLEEHVVLLGSLTQAEAADEMQRAHAFVHAADYETYSAVCAEALCCGTFTIASRVGGIPEFLDARSGALVAVNEAEAWASAIEAEWQRALAAEPQRIAERMRARCAPEPVGARYAALLHDLAAGRMR